MSKNIITPDALAMVAAFHVTFKHPIEPKPCIPSEARCKLRIELLQEELKELQEAINNGDIIGVADALCDLQYVLSGAILEFGMGERFHDLFTEVQRSNMSKACTTEIEAMTTCEDYFNQTGKKCVYEEVEGKWLVYREEDRKTIKSIGYSPANLEAFI